MPLTPLERLAREVYADDPAEFFMPKGEGMRPKELVARMQKAVAVMQFKLEGQMIERNPHWELDHRRLMHRIDLENGTIEIDGVVYELRDKYLPTVDPQNPYALTAEEQDCLDRLKASFLSSQKLREQMRYMVGHGSMYLQRGDCLIFHGCVPTDPEGNFLSFEIDGEAYGDHGYTLVLEPHRIVLAEHHHFESMESAIKDGVDIVPQTQDIRVFETPQCTQDTERGKRIKYRIKELQRLIKAYRSNRLHER